MSWRESINLWIYSTSNDSPLWWLGVLKMSYPTRYETLFSFFFFSTPLFSGRAIDDDIWHHVAVTFDHSSSLLQLYIDGDKVLSQLISVSSDIIVPSGAFVLGKADGGGLWQCDVVQCRVISVMWCHNMVWCTVSVFWWCCKCLA